MNTVFATIYSENDLKSMIQDEVQNLNDLALVNTDYWTAHDVLRAVKFYLCSDAYPKHPRADKMMEDILQAETSEDEYEVYRCATMVILDMLRNKDGKQYLDTAYTNALKHNTYAVSDMLEDNRVQGAISMMYDGFFDMCLSSETSRPTEFVEIMKDDTKHSSSVILFLADDVDKFLEVAKVGDGDFYTLGRVEKDSPYLLLSISKADGKEEVHPFIPVKWIRNAVATNPFVQSLISPKEVNHFYRKDLQK